MLIIFEFPALNETQLICVHFSIPICQLTKPLSFLTNFEVPRSCFSLNLPAVFENVQINTGIVGSIPLHFLYFFQ